MNMIQEQLQAPCADFQLLDISKFFEHWQKLLCSLSQLTMGNIVQNLSDHSSLKSHYFRA